ncbi:CPBP family intramembrane metalloprotease domain-containing protein [Halobacteriales archaeon QS_5_68_33]|nr:MAG: CPBP family intramembrane metalloprotease domain-containing protein [Halobacteriales archaeon QS_5_68_33]
MNAWMPSSPPGGRETWRFVIPFRRAARPIGVSLPDGNRATPTEPAAGAFGLCPPPVAGPRPSDRVREPPCRARGFNPAGADVPTMSRSARGLVWNDRERRTRAPVRLCLAVVLLFAAAAGAVLATSVLAAVAPDTAPAAATALFDTAAMLVPYAALVGALLAAAWLVDRRHPADLGLDTSRAWWADCAFGLALGIALPGLVFALALAADYLRVTGTLVTRPDPFLAVGGGVAPALGLALTLAYFVGVGVFEELLFRGYLLVNLAEGLDGWLGANRRAALAVSAALTAVGFGVVHGANPSATPLAVLVISLYGGFFAASYLLTGRIAVAVGLHVTWNFAVSSVFGFPVSGVTTPVTAVAVEVTGPRLLTGGAFGPEGGLLALVALAAGCVALAAWVRWREGELSLRESVAVPDLRRE